MSEEQTTETTTETTETDVKDWKAEAEKWQSLARKNEERAKGNANAAKELETFRKSAMTDQERAVSEAEERGKTAALTTAGTRLARAELRAAAAQQHVDKGTLDGFLEYADLSRFVGTDGEPDTKAIEAAVKKLGGSSGANFDGGARTTADKPTDMNSMIRRAAGVG